MKIFGGMIVACVTVFAVHVLPAQVAEPTAVGLWQQVDEATGRTQGWFLISERSGVYGGIIAKMFMAPGESQNPICTRCEGDQKNALWLGLAIIKGMKRNGQSYEDGTILDPRDGSVYRALMQLSPDGQTLTVRGYFGIALLGRDQVWTRLPDSAYAQLDPSVNPQRTPVVPQRRENSPARRQTTPQ